MVDGFSSFLYFFLLELELEGGWINAKAMLQIKDLKNIFYAMLLYI